MVFNKDKENDYEYVLDYFRKYKENKGDSNFADKSRIIGKELWHNKEFVIQLVELFPNKQIAILNRIEKYTGIDEEFLKFLAIKYADVRAFNRILKICPNLKEDKGLWKALVMDEKIDLYYDNMLLKNNVRNPEKMIEEVRQELLIENGNNPIYMRKEIKYNPRLVEFVDPELRANKQFIKEILSDTKGSFIDFWKYIEPTTRQQVIQEMSEDEFYHSVNNDNPIFMLKIISIRPEVVRFASKRLIKDKVFLYKASQLSEKASNIVNEIIEDQRKLNEERKKVAKIRRKEREAYEAKKRAQEQRGKLMAEYKKQGEQHPAFVITKMFLDSNISKEKFCKANNLEQEELDRILEEVSLIYPELKEDIERHNKQASTIFLAIVKDIREKILNGELTVEDYISQDGRYNIEQLRRCATEEEKYKLQKLLMDAIANNKLSFMGYKKILGTGITYEEVIKGIEDLIRETKAQYEGILNASINRKIKENEEKLKKYQQPLNRKIFLGGTRTFPKLNIQMTVTDKHIELAEDYLKTKGEYICHYTVDQTISKIAKGEITKEKVDLLKAAIDKKKERETLSKEAKETEKEKEEIKQLMDKYLLIKKQRDGEEVSGEEIS